MYVKWFFSQHWICVYDAHDAHTNPAQLPQNSNAIFAIEYHFDIEFVPLYIQHAHTIFYFKFIEYKKNNLIPLQITFSRCKVHNCNGSVEIKLFF